MSIDRCGPTATLLPDGRVVVSGGSTTLLTGDPGARGGPEATAEIYDPALGTWSPTGSMTTGRSGHTATLLPDGRLLVSGGSAAAASLVISASAEIYDPMLGTWSLTDSMSTAAGVTRPLCCDGGVLVPGGFSGLVAAPGPPTLGAVATTEIFASGATPAADVRIKLSAPNQITPGGTLTYSMTVTNASKTAATGVVVSNRIPAGTVFASTSASQGTVSAPAVSSNGTVTVNVGSLAGRATATITVLVTVTGASGTVLTDTATVTATTQDLKSRNNSATQHTRVRQKK
jgi:uncharacterized repeat protein (TIGR01451 family)